MPTFALQPVNGDSNIDLPDGETLIGRGPCFGISDKRVSRNHALLNVSSDGLRIKPTHINPCFYQPSDKDEQQVLEKDKWYPLYKGDIFSLLPDKYIFRVISTDSDSDTDATLNNSQILDEQLLDEDPAPSSSVPLTVDKSPGCSSVSSIDQKTAPADQRNASNQAFQPFVTEDNDKKDQQRLPERKRVLPAWMLQGDLGNQSPSKSHNKGNERAGRGKTKGNAEESKPGVSQQKRRQWSSSDSAEEDEEIQQQIKKKSRSSKSKTKGSSLKSEEKEDDNAVEAKGKSVIQNQRKNEKSQSEGKDEFLLNNKEPENKEAVNKPQQPDEKSNLQISDNEEEEATPTVSHQVQQNNSLQCNTSQKETPVKGSQSQKVDSRPSEPSQNADVAQAAEKGICKRMPCVYAEKCYRKNPNHFKEFSHPGDEDYNQSAQDVNVSDSDDDRPECPYGTACYRKNPQHKMEYKHTENPVPEAKRKRPKQKAANKGKSVLDGDSDDDGEPNDYDLNDSFIDDEISEEEEEEFDQSDEDSDWEPESEEVDVLVKEATQFVKSKR